jgi:hypothetical protein
MGLCTSKEEQKPPAPALRTAAKSGEQKQRDAAEALRAAAESGDVAAARAALDAGADKDCKDKVRSSASALRRAATAGTRRGAARLSPRHPRVSCRVYGSVLRRPAAASWPAPVRICA